MTKLRAKNGGHIYEVVDTKTTKGVKHLKIHIPSQPSEFDTWLPETRVNAIAEPAWEWDESLYNLLDEANVRCAGLIEVNIEVFGNATNALCDCLELIEKLRNGEL